MSRSAAEIVKKLWQDAPRDIGKEELILGHAINASDLLPDTG